MRGPDFELAPITEWAVAAGGTARLTLADGSHWSITTSTPMFGGVKAMIELAQQLKRPIFVSGDRASGSIERVALPEPLSPSDVAKEPSNGQLTVVFHGPPTPAFLRTERPWFNSARDRLRESVQRETPRSLPPPLLVTIDAVTREIMDVRTP